MALDRSRMPAIPITLPECRQLQRRSFCANDLSSLDTPTLPFLMQPNDLAILDDIDATAVNRGA